jgi:hypothetical protein
MAFLTAFCAWSPLFRPNIATRVCDNRSKGSIDIMGYFIRHSLIGALLVFCASGPCRADAFSGNGYSGPSPRYGLFSDPSPGSASDYRLSYVAPPVPSPIYVDPTAGTYCRRYSQSVHVAGRIQENYGVACLQPNGSWRTVQ